MARGFFDIRTPAFRPLWLRVLIVVLALGWAVVEFANGAPGWAILFGAAGLWCAWQFFVIWNDPRDDNGKDEM